MLNIIFQDDSILVIDKPSGLITISDSDTEKTDRPGADEEHNDNRRRQPEGLCF